MSRLVLLRRKGLGLASLTNVKNAINEMVPNTARINRVELGTRLNYDMVINWGNTHSHIFDEWDNVINTPWAIAKSSSKGSFRKLLFTNGLSMTTYYNEIPPFDGTTKYVVRPTSHFGGKDLFVVDNLSDYYQVKARFGSVYASLLVDKVKEFRVFVANGRVVYVVEKVVMDTSAVAWNVHQGGRFEAISWGNWNLDVVKKAIKSVNLAGLDFGAVDVMVDNDGKSYVLEVNSAPALLSPYWIACVSKVFLYMLENGSNRIRVDYDKNNYKDFIHPAISNSAIIPPHTRMVERPITREVYWHVEIDDMPDSERERMLNQIAESIRNGEFTGSVSYEDTIMVEEPIEEGEF